mgnify:CR=1 FL=1
MDMKFNADVIVVGAGASGMMAAITAAKNGKKVFPEELELLVNRLDIVEESMIFGMPDDVKEIAMQCLDKTLSQQRIATMVKQFMQSRTCVPVFDSTKNIEQSVLQFDASDVVDDLTVQCIDKTLSRQNIKTKMHQLSHVRTK